MSEQQGRGAPALEDGWSPATPAGDTLLRDYVDSLVRYLVDAGAAVGAATVEDHDLGGVHHGAEFPFANFVVARRPMSESAWRDAIRRLRAAFPAGMPFALFSPCPTPSLAAEGFTLAGHPPFMLRPPGAPPTRPGPSSLTITAVDSVEGLDRFEQTLIDAYPGGPAGTMFGAGLLDVRDVTLWTAELDGMTVATAAGHHGGRVNGVEIISCRPEVRGRGIGEAVTWTATLARPELPAALIASDAGRPVYERMGFLAVSRFTLWIGA